MNGSLGGNMSVCSVPDALSRALDGLAVDAGGIGAEVQCSRRAALIHNQLADQVLSNVPGQLAAQIGLKHVWLRGYR